MSRYGEQVSYKVKWSGRVRSIQPRTRVWRYITHNRTHYHIGYNVFLTGESENDLEEFTVAISEKQLQKLDLQIDDELKGHGLDEKIPCERIRGSLPSGEYEGGQKGGAVLRWDTPLDRTTAGAGHLREKGRQDAKQEPLEGEVLFLLLGHHVQCGNSVGF